MADVSAQTHHRSIRLLHWLIVALIVGQWISAGWMEDFFHRTGEQIGVLPDTFGAAWHMSFGIAIFLLMTGRFVVRMKVGTPDVPHDLPWVFRQLARITHFTFYVVLVMLPLTGLASLFFARDIAGAHIFLKNALLVIACLHVLGVAYHMAILRDGLLWRMIKRPGSGREAGHPPAA